MNSYTKLLLSAVLVMAIAASSAYACPGTGHCPQNSSSAYPYVEVLRLGEYGESTSAIAAKQSCDITVRYPRSLSEPFIDGSCSLQFDFSTTESLENVELTCSDPAFARVTRNSLNSLKCDVLEIANLPVTLRDVDLMIYFHGAPQLGH